MAEMNIKNIPDELYREVKIRAAQKGTTVRHIVLCAIEKEINTGGKKEVVVD